MEPGRRKRRGRGRSGGREDLKVRKGGGEGDEIEGVGQRERKNRGAGGRVGGGEGLFLSAEADDSIIKSHVVVNRTHSEPLESFGVQARPPRLALPRLYNQKQHFRRFPRGGCGRLARLEGSSPRDRVAWVHEGLTYIQDETHDHQNRPQRASGSYLCPQTATALRVAGVGLVSWRERLGRCGGCAQAVGRRASFPAYLSLV